MVKSNLGKDGPAFLQRITPEQWTVVLEMLLPEQQLRLMTEDTLTQVFAFVNGETQEPQISMAPLKQSLLGPAGVDAAVYILHSQPDCTVEQAAKMFTSSGDEICNPPPEILALMRKPLQTVLRQVAATLPDQVPMMGKAADSSLQASLRGLQAGRMLMRISPILPVMLLLMLTAAAVRTLQDWLVWWGWPLLLTGFLGMPGTLLASPLMAWVFELLLPKSIAAIMPVGFSSSIRSVIQATLSEMLKPVFWESLVLFLTGFMLLLSYYLARRQTKKVKASRATTRVS
jgi:hypothetical protein